MTKTMQRITAALFCLFIGSFGILHILLPDKLFSPMENRNLAQLPEFSWQTLKDGTYTADLEEYLADQFPLRDSWMGLKTRYEYLLGHREFKDVYLCGDTLISKVTDDSRAQQNLGYIQSLVDKTDLPVYLGMIPTAAEIWRDKLPGGADSFDQLAYLEQAKDSGAVWVDMLGALEAHKDEGIYYRTDHHWTSLGAYYGYTALAEAMGLEAESLGECVTVSNDFYGTLFSTSGVHWLEPDSIDRYVSGEGVTVENVLTGEVGGLYVDSYLEEKDQYSSFMGGNNPLYIVRNEEAPVKQKLLVVRDSYSDSLAPFLSQTFEEVHLLDLRYYKTPVAQYAEMNDMNAIFLCYSVENFIRDTDAVFIGQ